MKGFSIRVHVGNPPRKQNLHARKPRESSAKGVRQGRAAKAAAKADRYIVEAHFNIDVHHYLQAVFRESNRERYYETPVAAKAKTVHAKEPRKPSRKLLRIRTKSFTMLFCLVPKQQLVASPASSINFVAARSFKGAVLISRCPTF